MSAAPKSNQKGGDVPTSARELFEAARSAREKAYCPYSGCKVGASLRTSDGQIFSGCNVENSSYGATVCAERVAIANAVSARSRGDMPLVITDVMVVTDASPPWPPCGMCRQVIAEFGRNPTIHIASASGEYRATSFEELLPDAFRPEHLQKA